MTRPAPPGPEFAADNPVLAEVVRSGFAESRHRGAIAAVDAADAAIERDVTDAAERAGGARRRLD